MQFRKIISSFVLFFLFSLKAAGGGAFCEGNKITHNMRSDIHHNQWSLIIYRSENDSRLNQVRCFVEIQDEEGNDAFNGKVKAFYEWVSDTNRFFSYRKKPYLQGGMAMHLNLKKGKYKIRVYTPADDLEFFEGNAKTEWKSEWFSYDTENPLKAIFVYPGANENGFYSGVWYVSWKAPKWFKFTRPVF